MKVTKKKFKTKRTKINQRRSYRGTHCVQSSSLVLTNDYNKLVSTYHYGCVSNAIENKYRIL